MELDLQGSSTLPQVFTSRISVDNMSWWFWMKAGMGFTLGAIIVTVTCFIVYTALWLGVLVGIGNALMSSSHPPLRDTRTLPHR
jgi:hypothetical protein